VLQKNTWTKLEVS